MTTLAFEVTRAYLAQPDELPAVAAYVARKGLTWRYDPEHLTGSLALRCPAEKDGDFEEYLVLVDLVGYRAVPPWWRFVDPRTKTDIGAAGYPKPIPGQPSVFHGNGLICAPWNRGAYQENGGPHNDWNGVGNWQSVTTWSVAHTVPDMIGRILWETMASRGRMSPLPSQA